LIGGYPASTDASKPGEFRIDELHSDFNGLISGLTCPGQSRVQIYIWTSFWRVYGFNLDSNYWALQSGSVTSELSPAQAAYPKTECNATASILHIGKDQTCTLLSLTSGSSYNYDSVIVESGGKILLEGDSTGVKKVVVNVKKLQIRVGGTIDGVGTGYKTGGPGEGTASGQAGSYGGLGGGVTDLSMCTLYIYVRYI
jgi:hypothetical protein